MDMKDKLEVIAHLGDHITYKEDVGICYDSALAKVIEDAYTTIKNGVTVQEWISVKDRLPDNRDDVLLCRKWWNEIRNPQMGWYNDVSQSWFDLSNREIHNVTHWMPLPQPPKGE